MVFGLVLPMIVAVVAASGAAWVQRRLRPDWATWTLTVLSVGAALAVLWALTVLAAGYAAEQPRLAGAIGWCHVLFTSHDRVPAPLGIGAWAALAAAEAGLGREAAALLIDAAHGRPDRAGFDAKRQPRPLQQFVTANALLGKSHALPLHAAVTKDHH